ncbi:hypothetical protein PT286_08305 [Neisseriaceae bacterium ESL0693]|nr:hypothetical protein [Neisseriaceae bacterium ESL0693]
MVEANQRVSANGQDILFAIKLGVYFHAALPWGRIHKKAMVIGKLPLLFSSLRLTNGLISKLLKSMMFY